VGIVAALPREVSALIKGWERRQVAAHVWLYTRENAVVACAGMGAARAAIAVRAAMQAMPVEVLLSAGLAGACDPKLRVGDVVRPGLVVDAWTGERFPGGGAGGTVVTVDAVAGVREKRRLFEEHGAAAVDMEAATVARVACDAGLAFRVVKAISDEANFEMEGMSRFATEDGQFREGAFALHAALRPAMWSKVIALGRNSGKALAALSDALRGELDWYRQRS
jgi:adenosylhomocysteine nucleosidase